MNEIEDLTRSMTDIYLSNIDAKSETYLDCYLRFKEVAIQKINAANMQSEESQHSNLASAFYRPGPGDLESTNKNGLRPAGDLLSDSLPKINLGR